MALKLALFVLFAAAFSVLGEAPAVSSGGAGLRNVREYGAVGDGKTLDTAAIQRAVDAGGVVYFPAGTYLSGTIYLKSGGGLELAPGATLLASPDPAHYNAADFCPQTGRIRRSSRMASGRRTGFRERT